MKTFEDLKPKIIPEFIKKCVELAEGFEFIGDSKVYFNNEYVGSIKNICYNVLAFSTLLHRAIEKIIDDYDGVEITNSHMRAGLNIFYYNNYQPCHLTACEMAILDCLMDLLK